MITKTSAFFIGTLVLLCFAPSMIALAQHPYLQLTQNPPSGAVQAPIKGNTTPEKFSPLLGWWEYSHPTLWTKWEIKSVREDGAVEIDYFFKGTLTTMKGTAEIKSNPQNKQILHLTLDGGDFAKVKWELDYYDSSLGKVLDGKVFGGGGETSAKVYKSNK